MKMKIPKSFSATMQEDKVKGSFQLFNLAGVEPSAPSVRSVGPSEDQAG